MNLPLSPVEKNILINEIGVRYGTAAPTHTPDKETEVWVIKTGGLYYLYAWADGAWRRVQVT